MNVYMSMYLYLWVCVYVFMYMCVCIYITLTSFSYQVRSEIILYYAFVVVFSYCSELNFLKRQSYIFKQVFCGKKMENVSLLKIEMQ